MVDTMRCLFRLCFFRNKYFGVQQKQAVPWTNLFCHLTSSPVTVTSLLSHVGRIIYCGRQRMMQIMRIRSRRPVYFYQAVSGQHSGCDGDDGRYMQKRCDLGHFCFNVNMNYDLWYSRFSHFSCKNCVIISWTQSALQCVTNKQFNSSSFSIICSLYKNGFHLRSSAPLLRPH